MIYLGMNGGKALAIISPANIAAMKAGKHLKIKDCDVLIAYAPDLPWLNEQIAMHFQEGITVDQVDKLLEACRNRPEVDDGLLPTFDPLMMHRTGQKPGRA